MPRSGLVQIHPCPSADFFMEMNELPCHHMLRICMLWPAWCSIKGNKSRLQSIHGEQSNNTMWAALVSERRQATELAVDFHLQGDSGKMQIESVQ